MVSSSVCVAMVLLCEKGHKPFYKGFSRDILENIHPRDGHVLRVIRADVVRGRTIARR